MKVRELIDVLSAFPDDLDVELEGRDFLFGKPYFDTVAKTDIKVTTNAKGNAIVAIQHNN